MSDQSKDGLIAVCSSLLGISTISVSLRLYARKKQRVALMSDDILAISSLVGSQSSGDIDETVQEPC